MGAYEHRRILDLVAAKQTAYGAAFSGATRRRRICQRTKNREKHVVLLSTVRQLQTEQRSTVLCESSNEVGSTNELLCSAAATAASHIRLFRCCG